MDQDGQAKPDQLNVCGVNSTSLLNNTTSDHEPFVLKAGFVASFVSNSFTFRERDAIVTNAWSLARKQLAEIPSKHSED